MKEATGELNMTVVTVVAIVAVGGVIATLVIPQLEKSIENNMNCTNAICPTDCAEDTCSCTYVNESGTATPIVCKNPKR